MFRDGTDRHTDGHGDSMTNSAQWGRVGENGTKTNQYLKNILKISLKISLKMVLKLTNILKTRKYSGGLKDELTRMKVKHYKNIK